MKSLASAVLKVLGIIVLAVVVLVIVVVVASGVSKTARQTAKNQSIKVLKMYATPPNATLADRLFVLKNTSGKTIKAIKFRVVVFNKLKEQLDSTLVSFEKPITPNAVVYCNVYTVFDESGLPTGHGCEVDPTNRPLLALARQVGCKPQQLRVTDKYKVKVLAVAY
jgi:hypothetical protein